MSSAQSAYNATDWQEYWENWLQTQQEFIREQMKGMQSLQGTQNLQAQWDSFFKEWQNNLNGSVPHASAYQQFFTQAGEQFLQMLQQFYQGAGDNKATTDVAAEWLNALQGFFSSLSQKSGQPFNGMESWKAFHENLMKAAPFQMGGQMNGFSPNWGGVPGWNAPNAAWGAQGFGGAAAPWLQGFNSAQIWPAQGWNTAGWNTAGKQGFEAFDPFGFYASLPGIGYTREKQEELNHLYQYWVDFETQTRKYNAAMAQVGIEAVQQFQHYLTNPPAEAAPLHSLKEIYSKWVDVCEDVYAKYALSDDYTRVYGEVVNALMAYKKQLNLMIDGMVEQMNLPTRQEVDSLHKRVHDLRRDNIQLKKMLAEIQASLHVKKPAAAAKEAPTKKTTMPAQTKKGK